MHPWLAASRLRIRAFACACSVLLHAGALAWMWPGVRVYFPEQQVVEVQLVATPMPASQAAPAAQEASAAPVITPEPAPHRAVARARTAVATHAKAVPPTPVPEPASAAAVAPAAALQAAVTPPIAAAHLHNPQPEYPLEARLKGWEGQVALAVDVTAEGTVRAVTLARSSGHEVLDVAALRIMPRWRFLPARRGDEAVEARVIQPMDFTFK